MVDDTLEEVVRDPVKIQDAMLAGSSPPGHLHGGLDQAPLHHDAGLHLEGAYFLARDVPKDPGTRDGGLLAAMGSPDPRQIDGLGGAHPLTGKVAIVSPSPRPDADVEYLFAQVVVNEPRVDLSPTCGNILAASALSRSSKGWRERQMVRHACASTSEYPLSPPDTKSNT